ncbi:MAG: DUF4382 domain-containing protein [Chromatiales bacterium]|nr:DUF4382 domain-containing protein [Chromatiales bacterium]
MRLSNARSRIALLACAALTLMACGGSSNGGFNPATGGLTIAVTDAAIDDVEQVVVVFTGVSINHQDGSPIRFDFDEPRAIDLLELTGESVEILVDNAEVPAGRYSWVRLHISAAADGTRDSYVIDSEGEFELFIPSGRQSGLQLNGPVTVPAGGQAAVVADWDLRQGLIRPQGLGGTYLLKPLIRLVDLSETGSIAGTIDPALLTAASCTGDLNTGRGNAVYVYEGANVIPADISELAPNPITTATIEVDTASGLPEYRLAFLPAGEYTVAFTCQASEDRIPPDVPDGDSYVDLIDFTPGQNAAVASGVTTVVNFE